MWVAIKAFLSAQWLNIVKWAGMAVGIAAVLLTARKSGKDAERVEQQERALRSVRDANDVSRDIERNTAADNRERLRTRWGRK